MKKFMDVLYSVLFFMVMLLFAGYLILKIIQSPLLAFVWVIAVMMIWGFIHGGSEEQ